MSAAPPEHRTGNETLDMAIVMHELDFAEKIKSVMDWTLPAVNPGERLDLANTFRRLRIEIGLPDTIEDFFIGINEVNSYIGKMPKERRTDDLMLAVLHYNTACRNFERKKGIQDLDEGDEEQDAKMIFAMCNATDLPVEHGGLFAKQSPYKSRGLAWGVRVLKRKAGLRGRRMKLGEGVKAVEAWFEADDSRRTRVNANFAAINMCAEGYMKNEFDGEPLPELPDAMTREEQDAVARVAIEHALGCSL